MLNQFGEYAANENLILNDEYGDVITTEQTLGDDFWQDLKDAKEEFHFRLNGLTSVASIPEALVNKWMREGFDFWNAPANEIIRKLKSEEYDAFVISGDTRFDH
ncbi:MAG: hypothetical protein IE937_01135 [Gammaproteobacteria bacterium]|nr:hypothetical protein [Gammaproteobacteria bacterium]